MVNFRYHLVSLIAVFMALALGVVLGSGPLATGIGDSLSGDLNKVREERDAARAELEARAGESAVRDEALLAMGTDAAAGILQGTVVAVVVMPGADAADQKDAADAVRSAGATSLTVSFTQAWQEIDQAFLQGYAGQLAGYVETVPGTRPEGIVAAALAKGLRDYGAAESESEVILSLLTGGDDGFIELDTSPSAPVNAVLVVGARIEPAAFEGAADREPASIVAGIASVLPTVTLGASTAADDGLVDAVRGADLATSSIDSVGTTPATVAVPFALVWELQGEHGHYGSAAGALAPMPRLP